jgi:ribose transport system permease protein
MTLRSTGQTRMSTPKRQIVPRWVRRDPAVFMVYLLLTLLVVLVAAFSPNFDSSAALLGTFKQTTFLAIVSIGEFAVILGGGIDLSVGSVAKLSALISASLMAGSDARVLPAVAAAVGIGVGVGLINSFVIVRLRVAPFVATFAMYYAVRGFSFAYSTQPVGEASPVLANFYDQQWFGVDAIDILLLLAWGVTWIAFQRLVVVRHLYALGGNEDATRLAGVRVEAVRTATYVLCSVLAALAGVFEVMRAGVGDTTTGDGLELAAITAVVLGGVSLFGGRGRVVGVLGGVLLLQMITTAFDYLQFNSLYQKLVQGLVILVAVAVYRKRRVT